MRQNISNELLKRHILPNKKAYLYFKEAILLMRSKNINIKNYVNEIYAPIAGSHNISVAAIIKAMSSCISDAIETDELIFSDCINMDGRNNLKGFLLKLYSLIYIDNSNN